MGPWPPPASLRSPPDSAVRGYDPAFLHTTDPVPVPSQAQLVVLDYVHSSVHQDAGRRVAANTAVNVDGPSLRDVGRSDHWRFDERLPREQQAGEDHVLEHARAAGQRLSVFTGCLFDAEDPRYRREFLIPRRFFKVVAWNREPDLGTLAATGYLLDQGEGLDWILRRGLRPGEGGGQGGETLARTGGIR